MDQQAMGEFTLPAGTVCHRNGIPFELTTDTVVRSHPDNQQLIEGDWQPTSYTMIGDGPCPPTASGWPQRPL